MTHRSRQHEDPSQRGGIVSSLIALVAVIFLLAVLYLARHPIFRLVGEGWVVEDTLERSDAIFVLSDDNFTPTAPLAPRRSTVRASLPSSLPVDAACVLTPASRN